MKKFLSVKNILLFTGTGVFIGLLLFLFTDAFINRNFRTMQDKISSTEQVDLRGLKDIKASGGAAVHFLDLKRRLGHIQEKKLIVDGMTEFHGYLMGLPTTFLAYQAYHKIHWKYKVRRFLLTGTLDVCPNRVVPESEAAIENGFSYLNLNAGSRFIPTHEKIDKMVSLLENLPEDIWVHFHCHHGKGRTSMMLVMLDIMKNAPTVSLNDIVKRQHLLGSENLLDTTVWARGTYTQKQLNDRRDFITQFYEFICQRQAGGCQRWSEWKNKNSGINPSV